MSISFTRANFPAHFEFGAATSAYQIEGSQFGDCGLCHWDTFANTPKNVVNGDDGRIACDHYHHWAADLDLMQQAGFDSYRFSTSWARILPDGRGNINQAGLDFYDRLVDGLLQRNLKPYLTLYHWELPAALSDLGGWRNRDIAHWFADYSAIVMQRLGDRIHAVATLNEPWCITWLSHFLGVHAPGLRDIRAAARSMHHALLAHGEAVQALRAQGIDNIGIVLNFDYAQPYDNTPETLAAAARCDAIFNRFFVEGLFKQSYPTDVLGALAAHLPEHYQADFATIATPIDWLGVNYYTRHNIIDAPETLFPHYQEVPGELPKTAMDWEIYPQGLTYFLTWLTQHYTGALPLYITENGMAANDQLIDQQVIDTDRIAFLQAHLQATLQAIQAGAPVKGYFAWSLLDNYEWAEGYAKRFGLVHVDFATQKRTPKASWYALQKLLKS